MGVAILNTSLIREKDRRERRDRRESATQKAIIRCQRRQDTKRDKGKVGGSHKTTA